ncbi:MAG: hypothetical protein EA397_04955 [Deltaproteobacteria bacterium]|nr:MAG: hypothetical protein EA397_04955 [Deltaproteobacteria bacterium]
MLGSMSIVRWASQPGIEPVLPAPLPPSGLPLLFQLDARVRIGAGTLAMAGRTLQALDQGRQLAPLPGLSDARSCFVIGLAAAAAYRGVSPDWQPPASILASLEAELRREPDLFDQVTLAVASGAKGDPELAARWIQVADALRHAAPTLHDQTLARRDRPAPSTQPLTQRLRSLMGLGPTLEEGIWARPLLGWFLARILVELQRVRTSKPAAT